jgi:competence protein ComEA
MFKNFVRALGALLLAVSAATAFAATDVNKASAAELDAVKGIGPAMATKILDERKKGSFKDWGDFIDRVSGVGDGNAARFSSNGLTVNGSGYAHAPAKAPAKKDEKK